MNLRNSNINFFYIEISVCCTPTIGASTCAFIWNIISLIGLGVLIVFDIIFILNPFTCVLTATCATQPQVISFTSLMQLIPAFKNYSSYDLKKFFLQIQVSCAGKRTNFAFLLRSVSFLQVLLSLFP